MSPIDLFRPVVASRQLNARFRTLFTESHCPAREAIHFAFSLLPKPDANFVRDFQTTGFDARIWELYLAAYFQSIDTRLEQPYDRPDFLVWLSARRVWVEAVTANPTQGIGFDISDDLLIEEQVAGIKLGSALWSKVQKRYWELPHVHGMPLVFAIADFHRPGLRSSPTPLVSYLYGAHARLVVGDRYELHDIEKLKVGTKEVPAPFFEQPGVEHVSAVLFSNAGTVAKFSRMGFDSSRHNNVRILRHGFSLNRDAMAVVPEPFAYVVGDTPESWGQEVIVCHNPHANTPLPRGLFKDATEFWMSNGVLQISASGFLPLVSLTRLCAVADGESTEAEDALRRAGRAWVLEVGRDADSMKEKLRALHARLDPDRLAARSSR